MIQFDTTGVPDEVIHELCKGAHMKDVLHQKRAIEAQKQAQAAAGVQRPTMLGQPCMSIDADVYYSWVKREGPQFWTEKSNRDYFRRHFPETRIIVEKNMNKVGWTPTDRKFTKNYGS